MKESAPHSFVVDDIHLAYDGREVVGGLDLEIESGAITVIVGPNACGKSTLLKSLARLLVPTSGTVELDGRDIRSIQTKALARSIGLLPQQPIAPEGITVGDLVARGRYPHQGWLSRSTSADDEIVGAALADTSSLEFVDRRVEELSGGQRQRVWIAMALAQQPDILLLDEPTTFLDVAHQVEVLDLLMDLNRRKGTTIVMVLHDLNLAARYADTLVVMNGGAIVASGDPSDVISEETVLDAFGLECRVIPDPVSGSPMVVPLGRFHNLRGN